MTDIFIPFYCTHLHLICTKGQVDFTLVIAFQFNSHFTTPSSLMTASDGIIETVRVGAVSYLEPPTLFTPSQALTVVLEGEQ